VTDPAQARQRPVLLAIDEHEDSLARIRDELTRRYESDYEVICESTATAGLATLQAIRERGADLALVLAAVDMTAMTGEALLAKAHGLHPHCRRGLLIDFGDWGNPAVAAAIHRGMMLGRIDYYVLRPSRRADEFFHRTVSEFLHEWSRTDPGTRREIVVVGRSWDSKASHLRAQLARNGVPFVFIDSGTDEGRRVWEAAGRPDEQLPVVVNFDGRILVDPSSAEMAKAYGVQTSLGGTRDFDIIIIGAGPAGLASAVYASSEGRSVLVVEGESIGGQAGSSSRIRNFLGFPRGVSGAELAQRAYQQAWVFGTQFLLMRRAVGLEADGAWLTVSMSDGSEARARGVIIASGVHYRRLGIPGLDRLTGAGVFYGGSIAEAQVLTGQNVYVVGGGNSAGQAAMHLSRYARHVTVAVRKPATIMAQYLLEEIAATPNITVRCGTEIVDGGGDDRLAWLSLREGDGPPATEAASALFVLIGATPTTRWLPSGIALDEKGFVLTGTDVPPGALVDASHTPRPFETSLPGVFAVGDVRYGSIKRVGSAVGEAAVAVPQVHRHLRALDASGPVTG